MTNELYIANLAAYTAPQIVEIKGKEWIYYGEDNDYFNYLISLYLNSTTNHSIINGISNQVYGRGISALDADKKPEQYAQMMIIFEKDCLRKYIKDFKIFGMAALQILYKDGKVVKAKHFPMETLRAEKCNEEGEIEAWYYSNDWQEVKTRRLEPTRIPAFGKGGKNQNEMFVLAPYVPGHYYYSPCDYTGGLPYAKLEDEIGDYLINDTINNFSGTKVVNFNNGVPTPEKMQQIKSDVMQKLTGARGEKVIVAFNNNSESKTTVDDIPLNDAPAHYQYLSEECFKKLIVAHRVTSPMLLGIREGNNGLGNNADEIETATLLMDNIVIKSYQDQIIDSMDKILAINEIALDLYFKTLKPLAFNDIDQLEGVNEDVAEEETGVEMSKVPHLDDELGKQILANLQGEKISEDWVVTDVREVDDENSTPEDWVAASLVDKKETTLDKVKKVLFNNPSPIAYSEGKWSVLDSDNYKIRYVYFQKSKAKSIQRDEDGKRKSTYKTRPFCENMMSLAKQGVVYRIEDIDEASREGINGGFAPEGEDTYDLFKYKGGCYCRHAWKQVLYRRKKGADVSPDLKNYRRTGSIPKRYERNPWGSKDAKKATFDLPNHGSLKYTY